MSEGEEQDEAQKTEDPTAKRLSESRKKGQVAMSREINSWVMLCAGTMVVVVMGPAIFSDISKILLAYLERAHTFPQGPGGIKIALGQGMVEVFKVMALPLSFFFIAAFFSSFLQIGPLWAPETIKPDISKISIFKGVKRLVSMRSVVELVKGIFKISVVGVVGYIIIAPYFSRFEAFIGMPIPILLNEMRDLILKMMIGILIALLVIAAIDLVYQRMEHHKKMRMTKQEVKDEYKQSEGDPHVKGRLRQLRHERARQRMIQSVPNADVIITNPTHYSIALKYDPETMEAPVCLAKGVDDIALRIREVAQEHNIVLFENRPLARVLYDTVDIDETIPAEHFKAVAEVISYVFKMKGKVS